MGYINRTISYFKRNGIAATKNAVLERIDKKHMDPMQAKANAYAMDVASQNASEVSPDKTGDICFSILVPAYETKTEFLFQMVNSVLGQSYTNLELVIADASVSDQVMDALKQYKDDRIRYIRLASNDGISDNTNAALMEASGDYIGLLDHDDLLMPDALWEIYQVIQESDFDLVYTDEDKVSADLVTWFEPNYKPDFNFDYLLCNNYICHFAVCRASIMKKLKFRSDYDGAQDYDMFLRIVAEIEKNRIADKASEELDASAAFDLAYLRSRIGHIPKVLYHWRAHEASTADNPESKRYAYEAGKRALADFMEQAGWKAQVTDSDHLGFYVVKYLPDLFTVRKDVSEVSYLNVQKGKVLHGPVLDGSELFVGMKTCYSGYLHRAHMPFDIDEAAKGCKVIGNPYHNKATKVGKKLFLPDFASFEAEN